MTVRVKVRVKVKVKLQVRASCQEDSEGQGYCFLLAQNGEGIPTVSLLRLNTLHQVLGRKLRGEWTRNTNASGSSTASASHLTGRICCHGPCELS